MFKILQFFFKMKKTFLNLKYAVSHNNNLQLVSIVQNLISNVDVDVV